MRQLAAIILFLMAVGAYFTGSPVSKSSKTVSAVEDLTTTSPQALPPKVEQASVDTSRWRRSDEKSALDDTRSISWSLDADSPLPNSIGLPEKPTLHIVCVKNETRVIFSFNDYMGNDDTTLAYRVDKTKAKRQPVSVSEGGKVVGYWNGTGIPFLKEIENARTLVVGAKPYNEPVREAVFTLEGVSAAIKEVRSLCGW